MKKILNLDSGIASRIKRSSSPSMLEKFMGSMNKMRGANWRQWFDHAGSNLEEMGDMMVAGNDQLLDAIR